MERRKFLIGMGSVAAGGAAAMGSGAFATASVDRAINVNVAADHKAYLALDPSTSEYASLNSNDVMELEFDGSNNQNGSGLNDQANTKFHNVFKVKNQGTNPIYVELRGLDTSEDDGNGIDPVAVFFTYDELGLSDANIAYDQYDSDDLMWGSPNPLEGAGSWAPSGDSYMALDTGEEAYVHMEFYLEDSEEYPTWVKDDIPNEFGLYANATNQI